MGGAKPLQAAVYILHMVSTVFVHCIKLFIKSDKIDIFPWRGLFIPQLSFKLNLTQHFPHIHSIWHLPAGMWRSPPCIDLWILFMDTSPMQYITVVNVPKVIFKIRRLTVAHAGKFFMLMWWSLFLTTKDFTRNKRSLVQRKGKKGSIKFRALHLRTSPALIWCTSRNRQRAQSLG